MVHMAMDPVSDAQHELGSCEIERDGTYVVTLGLVTELRWKRRKALLELQTLPKLVPSFAGVAQPPRGGGDAHVSTPHSFHELSLTRAHGGMIGLSHIPLKVDKCPEKSFGSNGDKKVESPESPKSGSGSGHGPNWDYTWGWGSSPGSGWGYGSGSGRSPNGFGPTAGNRWVEMVILPNDITTAEVRNKRLKAAARNSNTKMGTPHSLAEITKPNDQRSVSILSI
ncbi:hypothetical protein RHSIM_Rhsim09G0188700 [Rhododendron simsii]|uniref:Uncharacterized protein n=1 Tax=Rhododendron simsii TaxID=118357 RepID=A0A834GDF2_RHOSS|nr:hypothetical protein RHSIM_Rhsim09G0188700 [Rhododendron simsii]